MAYVGLRLTAFLYAERCLLLFPRPVALLFLCPAWSRCPRSLLLFCRRVGGSSSSKSLRVSTTAVERQQCPRAHFVHAVEIKALSMRVAATNQTKSEAIESGDMPIVPELEFVERMLQQAPQLLVFALVGEFIEAANLDQSRDSLSATCVRRLANHDWTI